MKIALNILITFIILVIWSDIETNSALKSTNYSNSVLCAIILIALIFTRFYAVELKNILINKK